MIEMSIERVGKTQLTPPHQICCFLSTPRTSPASRSQVTGSGKHGGWSWRDKRKTGGQAQATRNEYNLEN